MRLRKEKRLDKTIKGYKVRLQFFSGLLGALLIAYLYFAWVFSWFVMWGIWPIEELVQALDGVIIGILLIFIGPLFLLSVINRFVGPIICILTDDGIYHNGGFIKWKEISDIEYIPDVGSKIQFTRIVVYTKKERIVISHVPLYMLIRIKRMKPQIKITLNKFNKYLFINFILISLVGGAFFPIIL